VKHEIIQRENLQ